MKNSAGRFSPAPACKTTSTAEGFSNILLSVGLSREAFREYGVPVLALEREKVPGGGDEEGREGRVKP